MTIAAVDSVFLDTNVLLAATDPNRSSHQQALHVLQGWPSQGVTLAVSCQVLREYLVVATRPTNSNGLALAPADALVNLESFQQRAVVLEETHAVRRHLRALVDSHQLKGKRIHDANIVATMLSRGLRQLITENTADFPFSEIEVLALDQVTVEQ